MNLLIFRTTERSAIVVSNSIEKAIHVNGAYYSRENLATLPSSYILPKGSSLQVRLKLMRMYVYLQSLTQLFINSEYSSACNNVASGYRNIGQTEGQ